MRPRPPHRFCFFSPFYNARVEPRASKTAKKDLRTQRTRRLIRHALLHLLETRSFHDITVQDIIQEAQINRTTFYRHYLDKFDLVESTLRDDIQRLVAALEQETSDLSRVNLDQPPAAWVALFTHLVEQRRFYQATLAQASAVSFADYAARLLAGVVETRLQRLYPQQPQQPQHHPRIPDEVVTQFATSALLGVVRWWLEHDAQHSPEAMAGWLFQLLTKGTLATLGMPGPDPRVDASP
jgi:AcrR family transcriptional regulator